MYWNNNCYKRITELLTWKDAETMCVESGGHLTSVHSPEENTFLNEVSKKAITWLGGNDISKEGSWTWTDGSSWRYKNWGETEPNNYDGKEDCLNIGHGADKWFDDQCLTKRQAICKRHVCPKNWQQYGSKCYKLLDETLTWENAGSTCEKAGGKLASVHSVLENDFAFTMAKFEPAWLGGNDLVKEGAWTWSDKTAWVYSNWGENEPNNANQEHCLEIGNLGEKWNDYSCSKKIKGICMKSLSSNMIGKIQRK